MTAELHWFPFFSKDWLSSPVRAAMLPEQRGAYIDLLSYAWGSGDAEPSLASDEAQLAAQSGLGGRWRKLGSLVRAQFEERDGRLYNAKLSEVWTEQQKKHAQAIVRGQKGGKARADKGKNNSRPTRDSLKQSESEEAVEPGPKGPRVLPASAPAGALALEGARAAVAALLDSPPPKQPDPGPGTVARQVEDEYNARLTVRVAEYRAKHPEKYAESERLERQFQGIGAKPLGEFQQRMLDEAVAQRIRDEVGWPSLTEWREQQQAEAVA